MAGPSSSSRPDPEALLAELRRPGRGRLKVFFGAAPGVGKTYAMLEEARLRQRDGIDVVIGIVETHGRADTAALLATLEQLPRRLIAYNGRDLAEMDLDALLARRPKLAVIDELAHSNVPGSRHPKRWQDVVEVLDAGIDVLTTLNVQHVESLNDVVARITGVRVRETVPDDLLQGADEVELVDLSPDGLIERLRQGKVYLGEQAGRALDGFFGRGNLTALRELAMRTAAQRVDAELVRYMQAAGVEGPWPAEERILVCVNEADVADMLVRTGKRMASRGQLPWIAATVMTPGHDRLPEESRARTVAALRLAESLGAEAVTLRAESDPAGELLRFARSRNVTRLVVGRPRSRWRLGPFREPVGDRLIDRAAGFEVVVIGGGQEQAASGPWFAVPAAPKLRGLAEAVLAVAAATALAWPLWRIVPVASLAVVYLIAVLAVGMRHGLTVAMAASALGFLAYNFFFTDPVYSFRVEQTESVVALLVFFISAVFVGTLASRLKAQVESMRSTEKRTATLYDFSRKIASVSKLDDVLWAAVHHISSTLGAQSAVLMPDAAGTLAIAQAFPPIDSLDAKEQAAAQWAYERKEAAGRGTNTLPTSDWLFLPLATDKAPLGVMGVFFPEAARFTDPETRRLLGAVEDQVAVAVERTRLAADLEDARVGAEGEKLRAALLNSVSHDLRTPLVTIVGAATALTESGDALGTADRRELTTAILDEGRRLDRYVRNLLDMTRLGYGALTLRREAVDLREAVGQARTDLARQLEGRAVTVDVPRDLPPVDADPVLLAQVLANVLENAAKHTPAGAPIHIEGRSEDGRAGLDINDGGPGIPRADQEKVFDLFYRVRAGDGAAAGTGLGLAIARGLVEAHGGTIRAGDGPAGSGTTIAIRLPVASREDPTEDMA